MVTFLINLAKEFKYRPFSPPHMEDNNSLMKKKIHLLIQIIKYKYWIVSLHNRNNIDDHNIGQLDVYS